jgi:hypothetical protein
MKYLPLLALLALAACNADGTLTAAGQADVLKACQADAVAQPVAVAVAPLAGPVGAVGAAVDNTAVHPEVVNLCAQAAANKAPVAAPAGAIAVPPVTVNVGGQAVTVTGIQIAPAAVAPAAK